MLQDELRQWIEEYLKGTEYELITLNVSAGNDILVEVDRLAGVDVDFCASLNHYLVEKLDRYADRIQNTEDYAFRNPHRSCRRWLSYFYRQPRGKTYAGRRSSSADNSRRCRSPWHRFL